MPALEEVEEGREGGAGKVWVGRAAAASLAQGLGLSLPFLDSP